MCAQRKEDIDGHKGRPPASNGESSETDPSSEASDETKPSNASILDC